MIRFLAAIFRILHQSLRNSPQQILPFTIFFDSSNLKLNLYMSARANDEKRFLLRQTFCHREGLHHVSCGR